MARTYPQTRPSCDPKGRKPSLCLSDLANCDSHKICDVNPRCNARVVIFRVASQHPTSLPRASPGTTFRPRSANLRSVPLEFTLWRARVGVHASACPRWSSRFSVPLLEFTLERARARRTSSRCSANCRRASFPPGVGSSTQGTSVPFRPSPAPNGAAGPGLPWLLAAFAVPPRPERSGHRLATSLQWGLAVSSTQFVLYDDSVQGKLSNQEAPSRGPVAQR